MNPSRTVGLGGRALPLGLLTTLAVVVLLGIPTAGAAPALGRVSWSDPGMSWTNGEVLCVFQPSAPEVAVSASDLANSGVTVAIASVEEVSSSGAVVATTPSSGFTWQVENRSTSLWYDESYSANLTVGPSATSVRSLGTVALRIDFLLAVSYVEGATENLTAVTMELSLSGWPWQASADHLVVFLSLVPSYPGTEHFETPASGSAMVTSVSNETGRSLEYFAAGTEATVEGATGPSTATPVAPTWTIAPAAATVGLSVGTNVAQFSAMNYTAHVGIVLPASVAGLPLSDYLLVGGSAALIAAVVGLELRRVRRRPSDLIFVEEEEA